MPDVRKMPALMKPARPDSLRPHHLPTIPAWWPVPVDNGETAPLTPDERARVRRRQALDEAKAGPVDGRRYSVIVRHGRPPETFTPSGTPGIRYRLDHAESTQHTLVYRYDPDSPDHQGMMRAVEDAFTEVGQEYTITAREEDTDDHTTPPRLGYPRG